MVGRMDINFEYSVPCLNENELTFVGYKSWTS